MATVAVNPMENSDMKDRRFLFLQGLATPFFRELGEDLRRAGASVDRVNFRTGDKLWWSGPAIDYRGDLDGLPAFYEDLFRQKQFTDVLLFGDMRPVHLPVHIVAEKHGAQVHVFEEGYIRPNWITVEREGVNLNSPLPRDPAWYRTVAPTLPPEPRASAVNVPISRRAAQDLAYRLCGVLDCILFPRYRTHRPRRAVVEYAGWCLRYAKFPFVKKNEARRLQPLLATERPVFLLPLQLNGDSQILHHSRFGSVAEVIEHVVASFAAHSPREAILLIKNHPLDPGWDRHDLVAHRAAYASGIMDRVAFLETADLARIFPRLAGVVLVNSTTGLSAIWRGVPVHALAEPVYKMPGLTDTNTLERFWQDPQPPDPELFNAFRRVLLHVNHANGDYFTKNGIALAVRESIRLLGVPSPLEELVQRIPCTDGPRQGTFAAHRRTPTTC